MRIKISILIFFVAVSCDAAIYYIDWSAGNDSNNGTSAITPWKRSPNMSSFGGTYSHVNGDKFIFKGGVTWPSNAFQMHITQGGSSIAWDYYGVDVTYFTGGVWSRPKFSAVNSSQEPIFIEQVQYVMVDSIDISGGNIDLIAVIAPNNVTITNCYIHNWGHTSATDDAFSQAGGIKNYYSSGSGTITFTNFLITHCEIGNDDGPGGGVSGAALYYPGEVAYSKIHDAPCIIIRGGWNIHDTELYNNNQSYSGDATEHPDVVYWAGYNGQNIGTPAGSIYFYNNWIHNIRGGNGILPVLYVECGFQGPAPTNVYIFNNLVTSCTNPAVYIDNEQFGGSSPVNIRVWNNTFQVEYPEAIAGNRRAGVPQFTLADCRNNHCIGNTNSTMAEYGEVGSGAVVASQTSANSLVQNDVAATSAGYVLGSFYYPPNGNAGGVGTGQNLSSSNIMFLSFSTTKGGYSNSVARPTLWDIGAYQFSGAGLIFGTTFTH